jgi:hypothetical protein
VCQSYQDWWRWLGSCGASLFSHLQSSGSFKHIGQTRVPQPTHVLLYLLQAQWLHLLVIIVIPTCCYIIHVVWIYFLQ